MWVFEEGTKIWNDVEKGEEHPGPGKAKCPNSANYKIVLFGTKIMSPEGFKNKFYSNFCYREL